MSNASGMDIAAVEHLAAVLSARADEIDGIANALTHQFNSVGWYGPDADFTRSNWPNHRAALINVAFALRHAAQVARQNASQQQDVSSH
jgi:hypothetical protein